jgi:hypothetical protein
MPVWGEIKVEVKRNYGSAPPIFNNGFGSPQAISNGSGSRGSRRQWLKQTGATQKEIAWVCGLSHYPDFHGQTG